MEQDEKFKYIDFLMTRLEQIIGWTQNATKLIYLVNGAILAAIYFSFKRINPISNSFIVAGVLCLVLSLVNYLHANFLQSHYAWYKATEEEVRRVFSTMSFMTGSPPHDLLESHERYFKSDKFIPCFFWLRHTHSTYVWIHLIIAIVLIICSIVFFVMAATDPNVSIGVSDNNIP